MFLFPIHPLYNREMFWKTLPSVASQQCCEILILLYQLNSCLFLPPYTKVKSEGYLVPFLPRWQIRQSRGGWLSYYVHLLLQSQRQRQTASNCGGSANENKRTCSRSLIFLLTGLRLKAVKTRNWIIHYLFLVDLPGGIWPHPNCIDWLVISAVRSACLSLLLERRS